MPIECKEMIEFRLYFNAEQSEKLYESAPRGALRNMIQNDFPGAELIVMGSQGQMAYLDMPVDQRHQVPNILAAVENWIAVQ